MKKKIFAYKQTKKSKFKTYYLIVSDYQYNISR